CELNWPRPEGPVSELPCPGDVLFFEDRDLMQQRFRVLSVRPGADGSLVQAVAEPQHRPWRAEAAVPPAVGPRAGGRGGGGAVPEKAWGFARRCLFAGDAASGNAGRASRRE